MSIKDTSLEAYIGITADGTAKTARARVFKAIQNNPNCTRRELAGRTGIKINCVSGRVFELKEAELIIELPAIRDSYTGRMAHPLVIANKLVL